MVGRTGAKTGRRTRPGSRYSSVQFDSLQQAKKRYDTDDADERQRSTYIRSELRGGARDGTLGGCQRVPTRGKAKVCGTARWGAGLPPL
jgi:hypothetical protein